MMTIGKENAIGPKISQELVFLDPICSSVFIGHNYAIYLIFLRPVMHIS